MKQMTLTMFLLLMTAFAFAGGSELRPESAVPTPAAQMDVMRESPNLGDKENADWQKMRAERKVAREQILANLRNEAQGEKREYRRNKPEVKNEMKRFDEEQREKNFHAQEREPEKAFKTTEERRPIVPAERLNEKPVENYGPHYMYPMNGFHNPYLRQCVPHVK